MGTLVLSNITLADPSFVTPGKIDLLLGAGIYSDVLLHCRRCGPPNTFETQFGWVLTGRTNAHSANHLAVAYHYTAVVSGDDLIRSFGKQRKAQRINQTSLQLNALLLDTSRRHTLAPKLVVLLSHFQRIPAVSRLTNPVRRFLTLEQSLYARGQFQEFSDIVEECFELNHAELVPPEDLQKPARDTFYLPMHAVRKEHSTTMHESQSCVRCFSQIHHWCIPE